MGKAVAEFFGLIPKVTTKPTRFGGGFSGAKLSDILAEGEPLNGVTGQRHQKQLSSEPARKILLGHTAVALDVAYYETYSNGKQYDEVIVAAGHEIHSFDGTLSYDGEVLSFDGSGNETGDFGSNMNFKTRTLGVTGTTLAAGVGSIWTSTSSLTGCAFFTLRTQAKKSLYPNGVSMNYMVPAEGALVPDPRNGAHDMTDQSTWEYNDGAKDIGRNPALQILWYLLGWKEAAVSGEITCGKGVDVDDIDLPSFIAAANDYDTLGWFSDCVLSMGDPDVTNLSILKEGCGAVLTDAGGRYSIHAPIDDTGTVAVSFVEADLSGDRISWKPSIRMQEQFNSVSGSFVDPASQYRSRAYPKVEDASYVAADGFKRNRTRDFQSVQDSDQCQELNRIALNQTRFQGILTMSVSQKGLVAKHYDVVEVTNALYEFVDKKFRIKKQGITSNGFVELELQETDTSIYAAGSVASLPAPPAGTTYDDRAQFLVTGLAVVTKTETGSGGTPTVSDGIRITWTDPGEVIAWTEIRYKRTSESIWIIAPSVLYPETEVSVIPLESGTQYDVQARHQSVVGVLGAWSSTVQRITGTARDTEPGASAGATWGLDINNEPADLGDINTTEGTKLTGIETGATENLGTLADLNSVAAGQIDANAVGNSELGTNAVQNVNVAGSAIDTAELAALAATTAKIEDDAVTGVDGNFTAGEAAGSPTSGVWTTMMSASLTVSKASANVFIAYSVDLSFSGGGSVPLEVRILEGASDQLALRDVGDFTSGTWGTNTGIQVDVAGIGARTYNIQVRKNIGTAQTALFKNRSIFVEEIKK